MKIITINVNGLRAAAKKGLLAWLAEENPDAVCLQEIKAYPEQLQELEIPFPHIYYQSASRAGYSGVGLFLRNKPLEIKTLGWEDIDNEGRFLEARYENFSLISLYMHSGSSGEERQALKEDFMKRFLHYLQERKNENLIIAGDFNIAHKKIDIKNWRGNLKNSGFLPQEREWFSDLIAEDYCDAFRELNQNEDEFTWWSNRGQARENNVGWRIDYQIISKNLRHKIQSVAIYREKRFSDHAPLIINYQDL